MLFIKNIPHSVYKKANESDTYITYKKGDVIYSKMYSHEELRYIKIPTYRVVRKYRGNNYLLIPYNATDPLEKMFS